MITIFKNIRETSTPFYRDIETILERIRRGDSKSLIEQIRKENDKEKRNILKKDLPSILFSGKFKKRNDKDIIEHSGFICIDFDNFETEKEINRLKKKLKEDRYVFSFFVSPSGNGIKAIIKIPPIIEFHKHYFNSINEYYNEKYFDVTCSNISRVCYESYDPDIYINTESVIYEKRKQDEEKIDSEYFADLKISDQSKIVERLMRWWSNKYSFSNGERNNNLFILASSFNDFGVSVIECENVLNQFTTEDFNNSEIKSIIKSAYSKTQNHGIKFFEDKQTKEYIQRATISGVSKEEIKKIALQQNKNINDDIINKISEQSFSEVFWGKNKNDKIFIDNLKFKQWLEGNGFYKHYPEGSESFVFIKQENNLIDNTTPTKIKDYVINYLLTLDDGSVYQFLTSNPKYFKEDYLNILGSANIVFKKDEQKKAYLYFNNFALEITPDDIKSIDYIDLNGYVWKKQIINHDFEKVDYNNCVFERFVNNVASNDENKIIAFKTAIGYLLHSFNSISKTVAIILNDEFISDNPEGGTGKGILINAVAKLKNVAIIDGKNFGFDKSFPYQIVSADTQVIVFDDVKKDFEFQNLFSVITEGITLEKKNKDAIKIPREKSPKVAITTNYSIKGTGNSNERRKWELELAQYYSRIFTPEDEFNHALYEDWDKLEWDKFYSYMINCLQLYLKNGLMDGRFSNIQLRKFISESSHEFYEWSRDGNIQTNVMIMRNEKYNQFISEYPDFRKWLSQKKFNNWIDSFAKYKGLPVEKGRTNGDRWTKIVDVKDLTKKEQDTPF